MPVAVATSSFETMADVLHHLGGIPPERVLLKPPPGKATVRDVLTNVQAANKRLVELVDGILVEKTMGAQESMLAMWIGHLLLTFVEAEDLGLVLGADGTLRVLPKQVRIPDVCFISWSRLPGHELPDAPVPRLAPNLAIEVISKGNTKKEMLRKLRDYFKAGVQLVWFVYPEKKQVVVFTSMQESCTLSLTDVLDGGDVLPGFQLPVKQLFSHRQRRRT